MTILKVQQLQHTFNSSSASPIFAVNGVSFSLARGETLALIGESGSGKSTVGRIALGLIEPTGGTVAFGGRTIGGLSKRELRRLRAKMQIVFQEPFESLNPRMRVGSIVAEPLRVHEPQLPSADRDARVAAVLEDVGLGTEFVNRLPKQLSGGQQQRVGIARAIITRPDLVVLDEPTSSLDASVRDQILELLKRLQQELSIAYLFISHDIHTVAKFSQRTSVMYRGVVVESGPTMDVLRHPAHPYTRALLSATMSVDPRRSLPHFPLTGEIPGPSEVPTGCYLVGRCPNETAGCSISPIEFEVVGQDHIAACVNLE